MPRNHFSAVYSWVMDRIRRRFGGDPDEPFEYSMVGAPVKPTLPSLGASAEVDPDGR